ncbi:MAG: hypothetical protein KDD64_03485 [Bdellovibrionales bacterium]|nr:hypothetical protein [Bdellovibrionales bacterium]
MHRLFRSLLVIISFLLVVISRDAEAEFTCAQLGYRCEKGLRCVSGSHVPTVPQAEIFRCESESVQPCPADYRFESGKLTPSGASYRCLKAASRYNAPRPKCLSGYSLSVNLTGSPKASFACIPMRPLCPSGSRSIPFKRGYVCVRAKMTKGNRPGAFGSPTHLKKNAKTEK